MSIELASTQELIEELMRRSTFVGIILCSPHQHVNDNQIHSHFDVFSRVHNDDTIRILGKTLETLRTASL